MIGTDGSGPWGPSPMAMEEWRRKDPKGDCQFTIFIILACIIWLV